MGNGYYIGCIKCIKTEDVNKKVKGTLFHIFTGANMSCFCKEQLEIIYGVNKDYKYKEYENITSMTGDKKLDKEIYENINNGFEFTEDLGSVPYYCETCQKLESHFYFLMKKDGNIYTPDYKCKKCKNLLEPAYLTWKKISPKKFEKADFSINIYCDKKNIVRIQSKKGEKLLKCDYCGVNIFYELPIMQWTD